MKNLFKRASVMLTVTSLSISAYAIPTMTISDGVNADVVVLDNGAGDLSALSGAVVWSGAIGNFIVNVDTGLTKPVLGSASSPHMDLNFLTTSTGSGGTLTITFSDNGFSAMGLLVDLIGGTTGGTVVNNVFVNGDLVATQGPFGTGLGGVAFSGTTYGSVVLNPDDIFAIQVVISHGTGTVVSSGDKEVFVPDGGMTLLLLGSALTTLAFARSRKSTARA